MKNNTSNTEMNETAALAALKIVVFGGTGLIGSKVVKLLRSAGHEAIPASPSLGVNSVTGEGLTEILKGADVVVDVTNSPSFEDGPVMEFFRTSNTNLMRAENAAGVRHHVALSVVGTDRLLSSGYFRAKLVQENLIRESGIPYTIVRATQFFEFIAAIAHGSTREDKVHLPSAGFQPVASDDVAAAVADSALAAPLNGILEVAGPDHAGIDEIVREFLSIKGDARSVVTDESATYFGTPLEQGSLTPTPGAQIRIGAIHLNDWLGHGAADH